MHCKLEKETAKLMKGRKKRCCGGCEAVVMVLMKPEKLSSGICYFIKIALKNN